MSWAAAASAAISIGGSMLKKSPKAIQVDPTDPAAVTRDTIASNRAMLPEAQALAGDITSGMQGQVNSLIESRIPGFSRYRDMLLSRSEENLRNPYELPAEMQENLGRLAAERGVSTGGRGQFQDFSALRDFGLNMLAFGDSRIANAQSMLSLVDQLQPMVNPVSPLAFLMNPETAINVDMRNKGNKQAVSQANENNRAELHNSRVDSVASALGAFAPLLKNISAPGARSGNPVGQTFGGRTPTGQRVIPGVTVPPP